jgi:hypothetical protein
MAVARDPFKTDPPLTDRGMKTFRAIAARLATSLHPPIYIEAHIAQSEKEGKTEFSSLESHESTLDGINFKAENPTLLADAFECARDKWGASALTSMKEDPGHWALKASFGKTIGTGFRETWREVPYDPPTTVPAESGKSDNLFKMRFGTAGNPIRFTALHCAVHEIGGQCNIHIDESGFVLGLPSGIALTPDLYDHILNELKWKTDFRDWLSGLMPNHTASLIVKEAIRRIGFQFPNASNGYADLGNRINSVRQIKGLNWDTLRRVGGFVAPLSVTGDLYDGDNVKVQVTGTMAGGDRTIAISVGGNW